MNTDNKLILAFVDFTPNWAKNTQLRPQFESELKNRLVQQVPTMVARLAELKPLLTVEVMGYTDLLMEATEAFMMGHWRSVVALIGTAAESFTDDLYGQVKWINSIDGKQMSKSETFGPDKYLPEQRKLAILRLFGIIDSRSYNN